MTKETARRIRLIYGIILSIAVVIAGICLMAACITVYRSGGPQIYTAEKIAAAFSPIALPVYLSVALIAGGFLLEMLLPIEKKRVPVQKQYSLMLKKQYEKADMDLCNPELKEMLKKEQKLRRTYLAISLGLLAVGSIVFLIYSLNRSHYQSNSTVSMVAAMWWLIPCMVIPFGYSIFAAYFGRSSIRRELELVKLAPRAVKKDSEETQQPSKQTDKGVLIGRLAVLCVAVGFVIYGWIAGGYMDVLIKAVNICTECVGLG